MTTGSARSLEDAFRISQTEMVYWLQEEYGFDKLDAYQFVTQASESPAANVCDPNYTFMCKIRKEWLPQKEFMSGIHRRLRDVSRSYLS